jgi:hypothetical protein
MGFLTSRRNIVGMEEKQRNSDDYEKWEVLRTRC